MPTLKLGQSASLELPAGQRITITASTGGVAGITRKTGSTITGSATVMSGETVTLGLASALPARDRFSSTMTAATFTATPAPLLLLCGRNWLMPRKG